MPNGFEQPISEAAKDIMRHCMGISDENEEKGAAEAEEFGDARQCRTEPLAPTTTKRKRSLEGDDEIKLMKKVNC